MQQKEKNSIKQGAGIIIACWWEYKNIKNSSFSNFFL